MATPGRLTNPPITEALVDFRVSGTGFERSTFEPLKVELQSRYPQFEWRNKLEARFETHPGKPPDAKATDLGFYGLVLKDSAESKIAQFRADGFTLSQLIGYTTADDLFDEAFDLWERYQAIGRATTISRIALRYINRLSLPLRQGDDFERFLTGAPPMPDGTPQFINQFLTRVVIIVDDPVETQCIVTQRLESITAADSVPFLLDLDVSRTGEFRVQRDQILPTLADLRRIKNMLFFGFLKDEALESYR